MYSHDFSVNPPALFLLFPKMRREMQRNTNLQKLAFLGAFSGIKEIKQVG